MWTSEIETTVFSRVKTQGIISLSSKYPELFYTTTDEVEDEPSLPNVYVQELEPAELGRDLEGNEINAVLSAFQINVSAKRKQQTKEVMNQAVKTMKSMKFEAIGLPTYRTQDGLSKGTARFRRVIGSMDVL